MKKNLPLAYIELSQKNLIHNIKSLRVVAKPGTKIAVAIKGNAYGHGESEVAKILGKYVDFFLVNSFPELEVLRKTNNKRTFIIGYIQEADITRAIKLGSIISVFSEEHLIKIEKIAKKSSKIQEVNIAIDAHLGREGILLRELPSFFNTLKKCKYIKVFGMYAHFANIEDTTDFSHAKKQIDNYDSAVALARDYGIKNFFSHISATSGLLAYEQRKGIHPVVRLGIGVYGLWPSENLKKMFEQKIKLRPVLSWKTKVAQIKVLPKGHSIGYGLTYITSKEMKVAVIPQGYADGISRLLSNKGQVLIRGKRCPILGRVMMNMFVVDASKIKNIKLEDEVIIIGMQENEQITAEEIAEKADTINYEVTTRISPLLPRIVV